jgi:Na+-transporting methylmalonyl-CoA/oxaloacetate decarboxylase gamma subunit
MLLDIIQHGFALLVLAVLALVVWESSKMISEKKERQRKGLTDYYDNPIKKENNETIS